ncbi:hypothetical protein [Chryseobacterium wangxinyae]|uniref:hypothetical protein n=1 Tax=Chryseobacterium sp. CY353 TaxID=2997334 RepID=UPI00226FBE2F|nr:hypothetical protein [Chryseobacterium sp. CY353]MCY0969300.1 hypothetical protein [Chryseobacterium sp. CY353]
MVFKSLILFLMMFSISIAAQKDEYGKINEKSEGLKSSAYQPYTMDDKTPRIIYPNGHRKEEPIIILNGKETTFEIIKTISPDKIESFSVEKGRNENGSKTKDKMIVTTKSKRSVKIISLHDLIEKYKIPKSKRLIFSIDGEIINENADAMQFDESNLMQIKVINLDKVDKNGDLIYLKILTRTPKNVKEANVIYIR